MILIHEGQVGEEWRIYQEVCIHAHKQRSMETGGCALLFAPLHHYGMYILRFTATMAAVPRKNEAHA